MAKKYKVLTPNEHFTGSRNGVNFVDGKGEATKEEALELMKVWGYNCPELEENKEAAKTETDPNVSGSRAIDNWREGVSAVEALETEEEITAFISDEDRASVLKAAEKRIAELKAEKEDSKDDKPDADEKSEDDKKASEDNASK